MRNLNIMFILIMGVKLAKINPVEYFYTPSECVQWVKSKSQYKRTDHIISRIEHEMNTLGCSSVILKNERVMLILE